jgi:hypothetical protein
MTEGNSKLPFGGEQMAVELYKDALSPSAKQLGATAGDVVRIALAPIRAAVWGYEKIEEWLTKTIAERMRDIPPERVQTPPLLIAGPVLSALPFTAHDEELRTMFENLLVTSMDSATAEQAHPAFAEVIRQMTSDEARILRIFAKETRQPVIDLVLQKEGQPGLHTALRSFSLVGYAAGCKKPDDVNVYLDNLARLGLLNWSDWGHQIARREAYFPLEQHEVVVKAIETIRSWEGVTSVGPLHRFADLTEFGKQFVRACVRLDANP